METMNETIYLAFGMVQAITLAFAWWIRRHQVNADANLKTAEAFATLANTISTAGEKHGQTIQLYSNLLTNATTQYGDTLTRVVGLVDKREDRIGQLEADARDKQKFIDDLRGEIAKLATENGKAEATLKLLQGQVDDLGKVKIKQEEQITLLKAQVITLQQDGKTKDAEIAKRDGRIEQLESEVKKLEKQMLGLTPEIGKDKLQ